MNRAVRICGRSSRTITSLALWLGAIFYKMDGITCGNKEERHWRQWVAREGRQWDPSLMASQGRVDRGLCRFWGDISAYGLGRVRCRNIQVFRSAQLNLGSVSIYCIMLPWSWEQFSFVAIFPLADEAGNGRSLLSFVAHMKYHWLATAEYGLRQSVTT